MPSRRFPPPPPPPETPLRRDPTPPLLGPPTAPRIAPETAARPPLEPFPDTAAALICEIKWVRGRGDGEFQAILPAPEGGRLVLARSPRFRARLPLPPDATWRAAAAHETLVRQLVAAGWEPCGAGLLNWYAHRFRAPARAPVEPLPVTAAPLICEIKWVRGRGDGEFQAILPAPEGGRLVLARSPRFRARLPLAPDATRRAAAAHQTLVRQLVAAGWEPCGAGLLNWYAHRFRAPEAFRAQSRTEPDA